MKKTIVLEYSDNKFINNIMFCKFDNINMSILDITNKLYYCFYERKFNIIIFMASKFRPEVDQFIQEYGNTNIRIFIYHDKIVPELIDRPFADNLYHLVDKSQKSNIKYNKNIYWVPVLSNPILYNNNIPIKNRSSQIICFMDNMERIPEALEKWLYPNTKLPIKLFNGDNLKHHQHLGSLKESEKAELLQQSKYYLSIDGHYAPEAMDSGCIVLDIKELEDLIPVKYNKHKNYQTYNNFLEILSNEK